MKAETMLARELENNLIADMCNTCCISCDKYKDVKEMNKECQPRRARGRIANRMIKQAKNDKR